MNENFSRLWLALRFSDLPLTAIKNEKSDSSIVVIENKRVIYANPTAKIAGAAIGMDSTTAQLLSNCDVMERNTIRENAVVKELMDDLYQFTPHIEIYRSNKVAQTALILEISSCLLLFSNARTLTQKITNFLLEKGHKVDSGLCHTAPGAWLLTFADHPITGAETREVFIERLNGLSIELLFDHPKEQEMLYKTGFGSFADIATQINGQSLNSFRRRLGNGFASFLCDVYGIDHNVHQASLFESPRPTYHPKERFEKELQFEFPVSTVNLLMPALESLLQEFCNYLRIRQQQAQVIEWLIADIYKKKELIVVRSDIPQSHWQLFYDLSSIQFENKPLSLEVDTIKLTCPYSEPIAHKTQILDFEQSRRKKSSAQDFTITLAKLKARLGEKNIYKMTYEDSPVPELTNQTASLSETCQQDLPHAHKRGLRPSWLFDKPEQIEYRHNRMFWRGYLSLLIGPERIIGEWWNEPIARDYYLAKRHDNVHFWIFFDLYEKTWHVHGVF